MKTGFLLPTLLCALALPVRSTAQSPYDLTWSREGWITGGGIILGAASVWAGQSKVGLTPDEVAALSRSSVNAFDRGATWQYSEGAAVASDWLVYGLIAAPSLLLLDSDVRDDWRTYSVMYAETMLLTFASVELAKNLFDRTRPFAYNDEAPPEEKTEADAQRSFYSSHTAFAFASAVFLGTTYAGYFPGCRWIPYVWAGSLLAAAGVGILRYTAGMHFPTDVITGALVGGAIGYLIPRLHRADNDDVSVGLASLPPHPLVRIVVRL